MIILGLFSLATMVLSYSYDGTYVECFDHEMCEENYQDEGKIYCYVGTCTDRCPPGYKQINTDKDSWSFSCACDPKFDFVSVGNFGAPFTNLSIPRCKCNTTYCTVTVYAQGIGYTDGLVPEGKPPNCKVKSDVIPNYRTNFASYMVIITMLIFLFIHCRSSSGVVYDFHRYYFLYVLGSIFVVVFVQSVRPFTVGFTRTMAFGIITHNSAEWNILLRLYYGKSAHVRNYTNVFLIMYYIILLSAMAFLKLEYLLYFSMLQGGFLDWSLVWFIIAARRTINNSDEHVHDCECCSSQYSTFASWFGLGAITHLLSVEILFAGFILNNSKLIGVGGFFLVPMFLFYTIWVFGQDRFMIFCGPSLFMDYVKNLAFRSNVRTFFIVPFRHTTRTVDVFWQRFAGEGYAPVHSADVEMQSVGDVQKKPGDGDASGVDSESPTVRKSEVEDCESFTFGIIDDVENIPKCGSCCCKCRIPWYSVLALVCISINTGVLINLPLWQSANARCHLKHEASCCDAGYKYGAW